MGPKKQGRVAARDFKGACGLPCEMTLTSPSRADSPHGARQAPSALNMVFAVFASCLQARGRVFIAREWETDWDRMEEER